MTSNILGNRIAKLRKSSKLTQIEFSKILNISNTTLSQYESGKRIPSDDIKLKIADYFEVSLDYLFGRSNIMDTAETILKNKAASAKLQVSYENGSLPPQIAEEIIRYKEYLVQKYKGVKDE